MDDALLNIFQFIKNIGFIQRIPDMQKTKKNFAKFTVLVNVCFEILSKKTSNAKKKQMLKSLDVFTPDQIGFILKNQSRIVQPFEYIQKKRESKATAIPLQQGGNPSYSVDGVYSGLLTPEQRQQLSTNFTKLNVDVAISDPQAASLSQILNVPIPPVYEKFLSMDISEIGNKAKYLMSIPIAKLKRNAKLLGIPVEFDTSYMDKGNKLLSKMNMIDKNAIMQLLKTLQYLDTDKITKPPISMMDWVFYPLWSLENTPFYGSFIGVPIDYLSVMASQLGILSKVWAETLSMSKDSFVQAILSAISVETAGAGLVAAPFIAPAVNKLAEMGIHIVAHMGTIMNMFINISRKNFGMAYISLCEVIPIFGDFMDTVINYMVIVNRSLKRNNHYLDILDNFLDNTDIVPSFVNPLQYENIKQKLIERAKLKIQEAKPVAQPPIPNK